MHDRLVLWPLAQMNITTGPAPEARPAATGAAAAPAAAPVTGEATATTSAPGAPPATEPKPSGGIFSSLGGILPIIVMLGALYFILIRGQKKEERRRKDLIAELKKGDRVMTIGGMIARVVSIDGDEVVLKVDESANVKATYRKSAIQEVLTEDKK
jgi:preprotein translocase subunit YajC